MLRKCLVPLAAALLASQLYAAERIVVLSSDLAEIVVALGRGADVVGRDRSARQPELAQAADIGLSRSLAVEPIARLKPSLVIGSPLALPVDIWPQLNQLGLKAVLVGARTDGADYAETIGRVGKLLGNEASAGKLASQWQQGMQPRAASGKRILISYEGSTVAGRGTPADTLIRAAGGINAAAGIDGYKPIDSEALARLAPDLILVADHNKAAYGGIEQLRKRADIAATPAGKQGKVFEVAVHEYFTINLASPAVVSKLRAFN